MTESDLMLTEILNCRRIDLITKSKTLTEEQNRRLAQMQMQRRQGRPLQYVIGHCDFMETVLAVDERVLIPRPETELLVDHALRMLHPVAKRQINVLDLGTGSGNIAIALAKSLPNSRITTVDISNGALTLAEENARINHVATRIKFVCQDMLVFLNAARVQNPTYDLIISNPPYIATGKLSTLPLDVRREPQCALDGGDDGLKFIRPIIECSHRLLAADGWLVFEIGDDQGESIEGLFTATPTYAQIHYECDYVGTKRIVSARLKK